MTTYVALLYSVVLPLGRRLAMAELRAMAQGLGLHDPRTIGATGNLTFESDEASIGKLEKNLEAALNARFGKHIAIIVRNADAWRRLLRAKASPAASFIHVRPSRLRLNRAACSSARPLRIRGADRFALSGSPVVSTLVSATHVVSRRSLE